MRTKTSKKKQTSEIIIRWPETENGEPREFDYDQNAINELGEILAELALNFARKQINAEKQ